MPTKKKRVGFIPRSDVFDIVNKLSIKSNLSISKIINILVEEALYNRGLFNMKTGKAINVFNESNKETPNDFKKGFIDNKNSNINVIEEDLLDKEIYSKFLLFLKFQEKMKKRVS